jgi:hypothetical protein
VALASGGVVLGTRARRSPGCRELFRAAAAAAAAPSQLPAPGARAVVEPRGIHVSLHEHARQQRRVQRGRATGLVGRRHVIARAAQSRPGPVARLGGFT